MQLSAGSTPAGVSYKQGSDVVWTSGAPIHPLRIWIGVFRTWIMTRTMSLRLAQRVEHQTINLEVTGSTPVPQPPT